MSFRSWREKKLLSQERVAEICGLSLRTVQRLEAGHRVSYASLRALATAFLVDVDLLERELYAMNRPADDFVEVPRWARVLSDKLYFGGNLPGRRTHLAIEFFSTAFAVLVFLTSFVMNDETTSDAVRIGAFVMLVCAFVISLQNRTFDRYDLWAGSGCAPPERARTWRSMVVEYGVVLGSGIIGLVIAALLTS